MPAQGCGSVNGANLMAGHKP